MEPTNTELGLTTAPAGPNESAPNRGMAVVSISLGFFSMVVFFWHPFSTVLASVGLIFGVVSLLRGVRGGLRGERYALAGTGICAFSLSVVLTLNQFLPFVQWDH